MSCDPARWSRVPWPSTPLLPVSASRRLGELGGVAAGVIEIGLGVEYVGCQVRVRLSCRRAGDAAHWAVAVQGGRAQGAGTRGSDGATRQSGRAARTPVRTTRAAAPGVCRFCGEVPRLDAVPPHDASRVSAGQRISSVPHGTAPEGLHDPDGGVCAYSRVAAGLTPPVGRGGHHPPSSSAGAWGAPSSTPSSCRGDRPDQRLPSKRGLKPQSV